MPFDNSSAARPAPLAKHRVSRPVALWLFCLCAMILIMIGLGGATRLTGSGLSIMEWAPVKGVLPPLDHAQWEKLFALYRRIPQYRLVNPGMGLAGFKRIFWLEWIHRLWGRLIGLAFIVPLLWFWAKGSIDRTIGWRLAGLFVLGGLQGAVGWFMVASGFAAERIAVAPLKLVLHLALALILYAAILWNGLVLFDPPGRSGGGRAVRGLVVAALVLLSLTILSGSLVAGTHAGFIDNTFPLMAGQMVPPDYARFHPFWCNLIANLPAVQFDHRLLATATAAVALAGVIVGLLGGVEGRARGALIALGFAVTLQYALGVATLLEVVPLGLALAHQMNAVLVLTAALVALHALGPRAKEIP